MNLEADTSYISVFRHVEDDDIRLEGRNIFL